MRRTHANFSHLALFRPDIHSRRLGGHLRSHGGGESLASIGGRPVAAGERLAAGFACLRRLVRRSVLQDQAPIGRPRVSAPANSVLPTINTVAYRQCQRSARRTTCGRADAAEVQRPGSTQSSAVDNPEPVGRHTPSPGRQPWVGGGRFNSSPAKGALGRAQVGDIAHVPSARCRRIACQCRRTARCGRIQEAGERLRELTNRVTSSSAAVAAHRLRSQRIRCAALRRRILPAQWLRGLRERCVDRATVAEAAQRKFSLKIHCAGLRSGELACKSNALDCAAPS